MTSIRKIAVWILVIGLVAVVAARALHVRRHLHEAVHSFYHQVTDASIQRAYAAEATPSYRADEPLIIYDDALAKGWKDWTWKTEHTLQAVSPVYDGAYSLTFTPTDDKGVWFYHQPFSIAGYGAIQFYMYGDANLDLWVMNGKRDWNTSPHVDIAQFAKPVGPQKPGWRVVKVPFSALQPRPYSCGFVVRSRGIGQQPQVALDDVELLPDDSLPAQPTSATVAASINLDEDRHPISPLIYGMAFAPPDMIRDLRITVNRWGGNDKSRYNWADGNAENAARDMDFRNRKASKEADAGPSGAADRFIDDNKSAGAESLITIPTVGWVAKNDDLKTKSIKPPWGGGGPAVNAIGATKNYDPTSNRELTSVPSLPRKPGPFTLTPDPTSTVYQDEWVNFLVQHYGKASNGGVRFYAMDNEPDIWSFTHADVHPSEMGYDDMVTNFEEYATAVKRVDPSAQVTGPVLSGWTGFLYSGLDRGRDNYHTHADSDAHGGGPFVAWWLKQIHDHDVKAGQRTLDVLDLHYYPQAVNVYSRTGDDPTTQALRLRAPRSLWDPTYVDESWIKDTVELIPRMKKWIAENYPGTKTAITEWDYGAQMTMDGGIANADALGIYGREDLYLATFWAFPRKDTPTYYAFKLYRNADGAGHGFGDISVHAKSGDINKLSIYAGVDSSTGDTTLMILNKMPDATLTVPMKIAGLSPGSHRVVGFQVSKDSPDDISAVTMPNVDGSEYTVKVPAYSMTLLRIAKGGG